MPAWSYSSIKTFDQCPKKFYHTRVAKDFKDEGGPATLYGEEAHKAAELFVRDQLPLPPKFGFMEKTLTTLADIPGDKHTELKLGLTETYEPCDFFDPDVWWRGVADLVITRGPLAYLVDYKTGKSARYADTKQLDLLAGALFAHYPEITRVKSALAFVVSGEFIHKEHVVAKRDEYLNVFENALDRLDMAYEKDQWRPSPTGLCGFCPVISCLHNRSNDYDRYNRPNRAEVRTLRRN